MGVVESARHSVRGRGLDYYLNDYVLEVQQTGEHLYKAKVKGRLKNPYNVLYNDKHPTKCQCNCPHAKSGVRMVCKHMIAVFYELHPEEAEKILEAQRIIEEERQEAERLYQQAYNQRLKEVTEKINQLSVEQLRQLVIDNKMSNFYMEYHCLLNQDEYDEEDEDFLCDRYFYDEEDDYY